MPQFPVQPDNRQPAHGQQAARDSQPGGGEPLTGPHHGPGRGPWCARGGGHTIEIRESDGDLAGDGDCRQESCLHCRLGRRLAGSQPGSKTERTPADGNGQWHEPNQGDHNPGCRQHSRGNLAAAREPDDQEQAHQHGASAGCRDEQRQQAFPGDHLRPFFFRSRSCSSWISSLLSVACSQKCTSSGPAAP